PVSGAPRATPGPGGRARVLRRAAAVRPGRPPVPSSVAVAELPAVAAGSRAAPAAAAHAGAAPAAPAGRAARAPAAAAAVAAPFCGAARRGPADLPDEAV